MSGRIYPTVAEAVEMHRQLIDEFGGSHGLRDKALLEAAILRPQSGYYNSIVEEAAALMESLANNHAFIDGNKRVSFAVTDTFLRLNGLHLQVESVVAYNFMTESLSNGQFRFAAIKEWISSVVKPLD